MGQGAAWQTGMYQGLGYQSQHLIFHAADRRAELVGNHLLHGFIVIIPVDPWVLFQYRLGGLIVGFGGSLWAAQQKLTVQHKDVTAFEPGHSACIIELNVGEPQGFGMFAAWRIGTPLTLSP